MQQTGEKKKREVKRYHCSNPNCKSVFSRPKKIIYYVCPTCQTLIEITAVKGQTVKAEEHVPIKESARRKKGESKEVEKPKQVQNQEPKPIEMAPTEQPSISEEEENTPSDSGCKHYFGYLSHRQKGEGIPNTCLDCPKSLDCMLSDYYKSKEPVEEIKKWYPAKA
jgi:hypothetical protein